MENTINTIASNKVDVMGNAKAKFAEWHKGTKAMYGIDVYYNMYSRFIVRELENVKAENNDMTEYIEEIGKYIAWVVFYHEKEKDIDLVTRYLILVAQHFGIESMIDWCNLSDVAFEEIDRIINTEL